MLLRNGLQHHVAKRATLRQIFVKEDEMFVRVARKDQRVSKMASLPIPRVCVVYGSLLI